MATLPRTEHRVARSLAETLDPQEALERALAAIGEGLGWRLGAAWEPPPGNPGVLVCVETWCASGVDDSEFVSTSRGLALAPGEGLPGRVWATGEAAWIADVQSDANFPRAAAARRAGLHAAFCFPLRSARGVLGVVEFYTGEARELDTELLEMMATLGDQIGQAVERRRDAEHLRAAADAPRGDAGRRARRGHQHRRGRARARVQPRGRAHLRLQRRGGGGARHGRADRPAGAARAPPRGASRGT